MQKLSVSVHIEGSKHGARAQCARVPPQQAVALTTGTPPSQYSQRRFDYMTIVENCRALPTRQNL